MNCLSCQREIPTKLGYISNCNRYCHSCFLYIIEKRVRKYIKEHQKLKRGQRIIAKDPASRYFVEHVLHVPLTVIEKAEKKTDIIVQLETLDDVVVVFLEQLFFGKKKQKKKSIDLCFFNAVTDEELTLFCQYYNIFFKPKKHKLKELLLKLEREHPGTLYALYKSANDLKGIF